jgi:Holliday junction DNA helicase RuvA
MIAFLDGKLILKRDKFVIIEVASVGYKVFLSKASLFKIPEIGGTIKVYTYQNIKEDISDLYGFLSYEELEFFEILNDIHGVGPKAALELSVLGPLDKIKDRILAQDEKIFEGIPGIGSKRASTIILELTGKIKTMTGGKKESADEAENALVQLGFSKQQAKDALNGVSGKNTEERIKLALKNLKK